MNFLTDGIADFVDFTKCGNFQVFASSAGTVKPEAQNRRGRRAAKAKGRREARSLKKALEACKGE